MIEFSLTVDHLGWRRVQHDMSAFSLTVSLFKAFANGLFTQHDTSTRIITDIDY